MVLVVDGIPLSQSPYSYNDIYIHSSTLLESGRRFASKPPITVAPNGVKYVRQKCYAVSFPGDKLANGKRIVSLGTEDVLTCHVIVLRYDHVTGLGHFDEYVTPKILDSMIRDFEEKVQIFFSEYQDFWGDEEDWEWEEWEDGEENWNNEEIDSTESTDFRSTPISLRLVGGYSDEAGKAERLGKRLFSYFQSHPYKFQIDEICLGDVNTKSGMYRKEPKIGGVCCDIKSGRLFNATFSSRAFLNGMSEGMVNQLLLGPSLIKKPNALKRIILDKEDQGYSI